MNHRRNTSRRRKGSGSERRGRRTKRAAQALAAAAAVAAGTQAYGEQIRFDNPPGPGHFEWRGGTYGSPTWLDITEPAANQAAAASGPSKIGQVAYPDYPGEFGWLSSSAPTLEMVVEDIDSLGYFLSQTEHVPFVGFIPSGDELWNSSGYIYYSGFGSLLPDGVSTYLGVRFDPGYGDGLHYGWVGVERDGTTLDAFAWGYETEPATPEPSTLAMLAFGAGAVAARRRRGGRS